MMLNQFMQLNNSAQSTYARTLNLTTLLRQFWDDEAGFLLSAELVLVLTLGTLGMVVGLNAVAKSVVQELNDVAQGVGAINQSYHYKGLAGHKGCVSGSAFQDQSDECDCAQILMPVGSKKIGAGNGPESGGGY